MEDRGWEPTYRELARRADLGVETVRQAIIGRGRRPSPETVRKLATTLKQSAHGIDRLWGYKASPLERYEGPEASARLTPKQRKALDNLILSMVEPEERARPTEDGKLAETRRWGTRGEVVNDPPDHYDADEYRLAADSNPEQGRKGRGAPPQL
jgi:hypothetical protein